MSSAPLNAYAVTWEARRSDGTLYSGARRVMAESVEDARVRVRQELAESLALSLHAIEILDVRPL